MKKSSKKKKRSSGASKHKAPRKAARALYFGAGFAALCPAVAMDAGLWTGVLA